MDQIHEELKEAVLQCNEQDISAIPEDDEEEISSVGGNISERDDSPSEAEEEEDYETCDSGVSEHSTNNNNNNITYNQASKKKKRHHTEEGSSSIWSSSPRGGQLSSETGEGSEFSDALSDTSLLETQSFTGTKSKNPSTTTSGLGSSKPSMTSLNLSFRRKLLIINSLKLLR